MNPDVTKESEIENTGTVSSPKNSLQGVKLKHTENTHTLIRLPYLKIPLIYDLLKFDKTFLNQFSYVPVVFKKIVFFVVVVSTTHPLLIPHKMEKIRLNLEILSR